MENTTANSGALAELRDVRFPAPDSDFFSNFLPEFLFAVIVGILVGAAVAHYSKLFSAIEAERNRPKTALEEAVSSIRSLDCDSEHFAEELWKILRKYLSERYGNPFFPSMTASEAVIAMDKDPEFEKLAGLVRRLEYAPERETSAKLALKELSVDFLIQREHG